LDENVTLDSALTVIRETLEAIREIEPLLPPSRSSMSFRERLITHKEYLDESEERRHGTSEQKFLFKTEELLAVYERRFGVDDFIDYEK
jgi:hypothetical protein